jgi:hypothetical protein
MHFYRRWLASACVGLLMVAMLASSSRADQVDNPRYLAWAKFKVGSSRTWAGLVQAGPLKILVQMKSTLRNVAEDHVTIETRTTLDFGQGPREGRPILLTEEARIEALEVKSLGEENLDLMGRTFKCQVYQMKDDAVDGKERPWGGKAKVWVCPDVPGGVVKIDVNPQNQAASEKDASIVYVLSEYVVK